MAIENVKIVYDIQASELDALLLKFNALTKEEKEQLATLNQLQNKTSQFAKSGANDFNNLKSVVGGIRNTIITAFAVDRLISFGKEIIKTTATFQKFEAVLTNTLGSQSKAQKALQMINDFASQTPFAVDELTGSFVKLVNAGFIPTQKELTKLGDLASSTGKSFDQLAEAIIDAQTGEFERLKEFGIRAEKSGNQVAFTFKGVKTQVDFTQQSIQKYLLSLGDLQGVSGSMSAISKTLEGQISNLGDSFGQLVLAIGQRLSGAISGVISLFGRYLGIIKDIVAVPTSQKLTAEKNELNAIFEALKKTNPKTEERKNLIERLNVIAPDLVKNNKLETASLKEIEAILIKVNKEYDKKIFNSATEEKQIEFAKERVRINSNITDQQIRAERLQLRLNELQARYNELKKTGQSIPAFGGIVGAIGDLNRQIADANFLIKGEQNALKNLEKRQAEFETKNKKLRDNLKIESDAPNTETKTSSSGQSAVNDELQKKELENQRKLLELQVQKQLQTVQFDLENAKGLERKLELLNLELALQLKLIDVKKQNDLAEEKTSSGKKTIELQTKIDVEKAYFDNRKKVVEAFGDFEKIQEKDISSIRDNFLKEQDEKFKKSIDERIRQRERDVADAQAKAEQEKQIKQQVANIGGQIYNSLIQLGNTQREARLADIQAERDFELKSAENNKNKQALINQRYNEKEKQVKIRQAQADKDKAIFDVFINQGGAIFKTISNVGLPTAFPLIALISALAGLQIAEINSRPIPKYRKGKDYLRLSDGLRGTDKDGILIEAHERERIMPAEYNEQIKDIPSHQIPELVKLGLKVKSGQLNGQSKEVDFKESIKEGFESVTIHQTKISEKGFEKLVINKNSETKILNSDYSWS